MGTGRIKTLWTSTVLLGGAGEQDISGWFDIGKRKPVLTVLRTSTGGTYSFLIDWSADGGATVDSSTPVTTVSGVPITITEGKQRWARFTVTNSHPVNPFTAHNTTVTDDVGTGVA